MTAPKYLLRYPIGAQLYHDPVRGSNLSTVFRIETPFSPPAAYKVFPNSINTNPSRLLIMLETGSQVSLKETDFRIQ